MLSFVMLKGDSNLIQTVTSTIFLLCSILYAIFPLAYAITCYRPVRKSQYLWSCFLINLIITLVVQGLPIISYILSSFLSYTISTIIFAFCGVAILKLKKCLIDDSESQKAKFELMKARISSASARKELWRVKADYRKAVNEEKEKKMIFESLEDPMAIEVARIEWLEAKEARIAAAALAAKREKELQGAIKDARQDIKEAKGNVKEATKTLRIETKELRDAAEERRREQRKEARERREKQQAARRERLEDRREAEKRERNEDKKKAEKREKLEKKKEAEKRDKLEEKRKAEKKAEFEKKREAEKRAELEEKKSKARAKTYFCRKCGTTLHKGGRYCQKCGERIVKQ